MIRSLKAAGYDIVPARAGNVVEGNFRAAPRVVYDVEGAEPPIGSAGHAVVELLQQALEDARSGNVTFVALAATCTDGSVMPAWAGDYKPLTCLAAVTDLRIRFEAAYLSSVDGSGAA